MKILKLVITFLASYILSVGAFWGLLEGFSYFRDDTLKDVAGNSWYWLIYGIPVMPAAWMTIQSQKPTEDASTNTKRTRRIKNRFTLTLNQSFELAAFVYWVLALMLVGILLGAGAFCLFERYNSNTTVQPHLIHLERLSEDEGKQISEQWPLAQIDKLETIRVQAVATPEQHDGQEQRPVGIWLSSNLLLGIVFLILATVFRRFSLTGWEAWEGGVKPMAPRSFAPALSPLEQVRSSLFGLAAWIVGTIFTWLFLLLGLDQLLFAGKFLNQLIPLFS